jgi:serine protease AprX
VVYDGFSSMIRHGLRGLALLAAGLALLALQPLGAAGVGVHAAWVDPLVLHILETESQVDVLVVLKDQADLSGAGDLGRSWDARGVWVVNRLQAVSSESQESLTDLLEAAGVAYRSYWIVNLLALRADEDLLASLARHPDVARIVFNAPIETDLGWVDAPSVSGSVARGIEHNVDQINAPALWTLGVRGAGVVIGIADTGVSWAHSALQDQYAGWDGVVANHDTHWWDAIHDDAIGPGVNECGINLQAPCDDYGHGTHVAGIAVGDDGVGNQIGVAPDAKWIACRNMDSGVGTPATYIECYQFFLAPTDLNGENPNPALRPHIVNSSFACPPAEGCTAGDELQGAVEALRAAGIFMATSAGNGGPACGSINTPPALEMGAYTVGAVDGFDLIAGFSSRGPVDLAGGWGMKPDLVAPGSHIRSSFTQDGSPPIHTYTFKSGTSMAAPHSAGGVALLWSAFSSLSRQVAQTEWLLGISAHPLDCSGICCAPSSPGDWPNTVYGYGRLDLLQAYLFWENQTSLPVIFKYSAP